MIGRIEFVDSAGVLEERAFKNRRELALLVGTEATAGLFKPKFRRLASKLGFAAARIQIFLVLLVLAGDVLCGQEISPDSVRVQGNSVSRWQIGEAEASLLEGDCVIQHAGRRMSADRVLLVVDGPIGKVRTRAVVAWNPSRDQASSPKTFTFLTLADPQILAPQLRKKPDKPPVLLRYLPEFADSTTPTSSPATATTSSSVATSNGVGSATDVRPARHDSADRSASPIQQTQFAEEIIAPPPDSPPPITLSDGATTGGFQFLTGGGTRSVEILSRGAVRPPQLETINRPELGETLILARGGVTVLIRDVTAQLPNGELLELGTISLSADRVVGWLPLVTNLFNGTADLSQAEGELYLEGDIVFRQGERIIYANSMYYNINAERGIVLDAEAITTIPDYLGVVRLKADVMQQVAKGNFIAFDAAVTTSRMGVPRYWLQSEQLQLQDRDRIMPDPVTGLPVNRSEPFVSSRDNFVYFGGVPILYWPTFRTSLERPAYYLTGAKFRNDNIFGTQVLLDFDMFQLFGVENAPPGADWELSLDYLSDRGPAIGTTLDYNLPSLFGFNGPVRGYFDTWVIHDDGLDTLGSDRKDLPPEKTTRGRALLRHRHYLSQDFEFIAEVGWISDRNFLEQYFENEWDRDVDHRTALRLRKYHHSHLCDLVAQGRINDFFTETEQLPMLEHYMLGGSIFGDRLTWSAKNKVGYSRLKVRDDPENPTEAALYSPVPGEVEASGVVAGTRQELALPVQLGPVRFVPSISGEASHYGEAANGESLTRLLGQAGVSATLPAWRVDPTIQSSLLNIRGIAHKVEWQAEYFYADSDTNLDELPLYDPLDDNAQEQYRSRFITENFGGVLPTRYDPRNYALRHGIQSLVASPSDVIADDLQQFRLGLHQRWQTKRGLPGRERIVDLFQLDLDMLVFPKSDRDNFGESLGPATYDMRYHVGDRVTLLSDGYFDFFDGGLRSISGGVRSSRPGVGDVYLGILSLEGPISSTVLRSTFDYRLNEKWIASAGTSYDFGKTGNIGQTLAITRIGESMLLRVGVNVDEGRDNVGVGFAIEPRFWPRPRLGRIGGQLIPPPGIEGIE